MIGKKFDQGIIVLWITYTLMLILMRLVDIFTKNDNPIDFFWITMSLCIIVMFQWWAYRRSMKLEHDYGVLHGVQKERQRNRGALKIIKSGIDAGSKNKCSMCGRRNHSKNTHCHDCGWKL